METKQRTFRNSLNSNNLQVIQAASHRYQWRGVPMWKNPFDFSLYWYIVHMARPMTIIEIGSKYGGSALWLADMLKLYGIKGKVVSLDINKVTEVSHPGVEFLEGDVADLGKTLTPKYLSGLKRPWMVIEDSSHFYEHSLAAMEFFHDKLKKDDILIIVSWTTLGYPSSSTAARTER